MLDAIPVSIVFEVAIRVAAGHRRIRGRWIGSARRKRSDQQTTERRAPRGAQNQQEDEKAVTFPANPVRTARGAPTPSWVEDIGEPLAVGLRVRKCLCGIGSRELDVLAIRKSGRQCNVASRRHVALLEGELLPLLGQQKRHEGARCHGILRRLEDRHRLANRRPPSFGNTNATGAPFCFSRIAMKSTTMPEQLLAARHLLEHIAVARRGDRAVCLELLVEAPTPHRGWT